MFLGHGDGTFEPDRAYPTGPGAVSLAVADLNGDGTLDLATGSGESLGCADIATVSVLLNRGDGTFAPGQQYRTGECPRAAVGDVDGDGAPDLVTANASSNTVSVLRNHGDGTFASRRDYRAEDPASVAIGDLNGDHRADVATANDAGTTGSFSIDVLFHRGGGTFRRKSLAAGRFPGAVVRRAYSGLVAKGHVISQRPGFGVVRPGGARVNLVVSRGRKR